MRAWIEARLHATPGEAPPEPFRSKQMTPAMVRLEEIAFRSFGAYRPKPYPGVVTFFRASVGPVDYCYPIPIWDEVTGGRLSICDVPGDHFTMIRAPHVGALASRVAEGLEHRTA